MVGIPGGRGVKSTGVPSGVSEGIGVEVHCEIEDGAIVELLSIVGVTEDVPLVVARGVPGVLVGVCVGMMPVGGAVGVEPIPIRSLGGTSGG